MNTRKILSAAAALTVALTVSAAPAFGLSKAGHQFAADSNSVYPHVHRLVNGLNWWEKSSAFKNGQDPSNSVLDPAIKALDKYQSELLTQRWPSPNKGDVRSLAYAVGSFRGDIDELKTMGFGDIQNWISNLQSDTQTFQTDFYTVQDDFHVPNSAVPGWNS